MLRRGTLLCCVAVLWNLLPVRAQHVDTEEMEMWFALSLDGTSNFDNADVDVVVPIAPSRPLWLSQIDSTRREVWEAWCRANAAFDEEKLIPLDTLREDGVGVWHLPEGLEPNALMNYRFGRKGTSDDSPKPLFIYLHGSGPREAEWAVGLQFAKMWQDAPSIYFLPQIPNTGEWYRWWQKSKQWAWEKLFRQVFLLDEVDARRVYLTGFSEGGYGSQRLASFYADYFAAVAPMAGGEPLRNAPPENLRNTPFYFRTGSLDGTFCRSRLTTEVGLYLDSLQRVDTRGYFHSVELVPGFGHNGWSTAGTTPWLSRYSRRTTPSRVAWEDYEMDGLRRRGFANIEVLKRPDEHARQRYDVKIEDNVVDLRISQVDYATEEADTSYGFPIEVKVRKTYKSVTGGRLRLYLDESLVDLSRPVTLRVNGMPREACVFRPDVQSMLQSVSCFYDPLRIFPVAVDMEY